MLTRRRAHGLDGPLRIKVVTKHPTTSRVFLVNDSVCVCVCVCIVVLVSVW